MVESWIAILAVLLFASKLLIKRAFATVELSLVTEKVLPLSMTTESIMAESDPLIPDNLNEVLAPGSDILSLSAKKVKLSVVVASALARFITGTMRVSITVNETPPPVPVPPVSFVPVLTVSSSPIITSSKVALAIPPRPLWPSPPCTFALPATFKVLAPSAGVPEVPAAPGVAIIPAVAVETDPPVISRFPESVTSRAPPFPEPLFSAEPASISTLAVPPLPVVSALTIRFPAMSLAVFPSVFPTVLSEAFTSNK
ncbi:MAG: hypothetical protein LBT40_15135, partial [Deltaproteobacteria bacterium]|nr:hypothetical protein [Deltaproteobacteria bacterium]